MLRAGEGAGANVGGVGCNRGLDGGPKLAIALDEFRRPRGEPEHVLEHEDLAIAGHASADADGRDFHASRDPAAPPPPPPPPHPPARTAPPVPARRGCARAGPQLRFGAPVSTNGAVGVERLRGGAEMARGRHAPLAKKGNGLALAPPPPELDCSAAGPLHPPRRRH